MNRQQEEAHYAEEAAWVDRIAFSQLRETADQKRRRRERIEQDRRRKARGWEDE